MSIDSSIRKQLILLARRPKSRIINHGLPIDWKPGEVINPDGEFDRCFTNASAWELIANLLEADCEVEIVKLKVPPDKTGYVIKTRIEQNELYIKFQLGAGKILGRSFHYSYR